jgi:hypothetical protein
MLSIIVSFISASLSSAVIAAFVSSRTSKINEEKRRSHERKIKVAEFRQQWINELRNTMAEFQSYGILPDSNPRESRTFYMLGTKIELLMDPLDRDYDDLEKSLYSFLHSADGDTYEKYSNNPKFVEVCQKILKREWVRLKKDLEEGNL